MSKISYLVCYFSLCYN